MLAVKIIGLLIVGYAFGLFQTGYIFSKMKGVDIRNQGSGNSGATNTLRVMGKKAGLIVFLGDALKTVIPCTIVRFVFGNPGLGLEPDMMYAFMAVIGFGVVLGHNFPFFLGFKGGKGISSTGGIAIAMDWRILVVGLGLFILVVFITRYVSIGSLVGVSTLAIMMSVFTYLGQYGLCETGKIICYVVAVALVVLAAVRHKANWIRLAKGEENKIGSKKKTA